LYASGFNQEINFKIRTHFKSTSSVGQAKLKKLANEHPQCGENELNVTFAESSHKF